MKKVVCTDTWGYSLQQGRVYTALQVVGPNVVLSSGLHVPASYFRAVENFNIPADHEYLFVGEMLHERKQPAFWTVVGVGRQLISLQRITSKGEVVRKAVSEEDFVGSSYYVCSDDEIFRPDRVELEVTY